MPKFKGTKARMLKIWELLKQESDEDHAFSTNKIIEELAKSNMHVDRRTVYNDILELNDLGYEVLVKKGPYQSNCYYVLDRSFDNTELGLLIDAVQASSFITDKKTQELTKKIAQLAGTQTGEVLKSAKVRFNTTKHTNEEIYYNISSIQKGITSKKVVSFTYFNYDIEGKKVYRKNGDRYMTHPVATVFNNDNYYYICYTPEHKDLTTYRIDRMSRVEVEKTPIDKEALEYKKEVSKRISQAFFMYGGEPQRVSFEAHNSLCDIFHDKFGENIKLVSNGETFTCSVDVEISPTFLAWCCSFGSKLKVTYPNNVVKRLKEYIEELSTLY